MYYIYSDILGLPQRFLFICSPVYLQDFITIQIPILVEGHIAVDIQLVYNNFTEPSIGTLQEIFSGRLCGSHLP